LTFNNFVDTTNLVVYFVVHMHTCDVLNKINNSADAQVALLVANVSGVPIWFIWKQLN